MPRFLKQKKMRAALGIAVTILVLVAGAIAYWTATGSGEGEFAKTKAADTVFTVTNVAGTELYPGGFSTPKAKVENVSSPAMTERLKTLTVTIEAVTNSGTLVEAETGAKCFKGWFEVKKVNGVAGTSNAVETNILSGASLEVPVELEMKEEAAKNQNGCKNVEIKLKYAVS